MTPESMKPVLEPRDSKQKRTILVVDDDRRVVDLLQISLSQNGYHVTTASTGEEGLEAVRRETTDLIILDLKLPKKNGYEVCAALKSSKDTAAIPVIMVSATAEVDARLQGLMHGADDYLTKPFSPKELLIKVRRIFERLEKSETLSLKNRELETEVARNREDLVVRNKELRFQVFSLETLMGLTHQLNSSLDLESLMGTVVLSVVGQLRVNSACLFLTDAREDPKRLDAWTFKGVKEEVVRSIHFSYDDEFTRAIRPLDGEEGRPVRLQDLSEDPALERNVGPLYAAGFTLVCPVMMKEKLTAILAVGEKVSGQDFQTTDLEMVKALSESA
ncbi:MAG TPA: response regulator, partial [Candidatus Limnocylindrales bacterium]|nr:response regulator [Candidatus Limnocylindrales bacterium]